MMGTGPMLIQYRSIAGGWKLLCVLVRKDDMAPNWRGIHIGFRKNVAALAKKATKSA